MSDQITQMTEPPMEEKFDYLEFLENLKSLNEEEQKNLMGTIIQRIAGVEENEETKEKSHLYMEKFLNRMNATIGSELKEENKNLTDEELMEKVQQCVDNIKDKNPNIHQEFKDEVRNSLVQNNVDQESNSQIKIIEGLKDELTKK